MELNLNIFTYDYKQMKKVGFIKHNEMLYCIIN